MTYNVFSGTLNPTHFTSPEIVAASQRTARAQGRERIYLMSLATQVVVRCSILCSKFTKNGLSGPTEGAYSAPSDPLTELRSHFVAEKEREEKKEGERGKGREGKGDPLNKNPGYGPVSNLTKLVLVHYLAKCGNTKIASFCYSNSVLLHCQTSA